MSEKEKNESTLDKSLDDIMSNEKNTDNKDVKAKIKESSTVLYKLQLNELKELLEKEKQKLYWRGLWTQMKFGLIRSKC